MADTRPSMLAGTTVLDFTQYLAGPTATRLMAELGANVIKVEQATGGDPARSLPFVKDNRSIYFIQQNRGKKSLCIDFKRPEGVELIRALIPHVDVVIENYGPGVMERRGLDYEALKVLNPGPSHVLHLGLWSEESAVPSDRLRLYRSGLFRHYAHDGRPGRAAAFLSAWP